MVISAIVLNSRDYRENDKIITCYSRQLGKIEILVRSAKKITSKLAPFTSGLYCLINLVIEPGKNYYHLIGGTILRYYKDIINDYEKNIRVGRILNMIDKITKSAKPDRKVFDLMVKTVEKIDAAPKTKAEIFIYAFLIKFLSFLGYRPEIKKCLVCHKLSLTAKITFDVSRGGIVCQNCQTNKQNILPVDQSSLRLLQDSLYQDFNFLEKREINASDIAIVKNVIDKFLEWHLR